MPIGEAYPHCRLFPFPDRLSLFNERLHSFFLVVACEQKIETPSLELETSLDRRIERLQHGGLAAGSMAAGGRPGRLLVDRAGEGRGHLAPDV